MTVALALILALAPVAWAVSVILWTALAHLRFLAFHRREGLAHPGLDMDGWLRFYGHTVVSSGCLIVWWLRAAFGGSPRAGGSKGGRSGDPVLCIHGFHLGTSSMWGLRRALEHRGRRTAGVFLGLPYRSPETYARALERSLGGLLEADPALRVDVAAHSMGGLVLRQALAESPALARRVRRVVTLGTPHHGTGLLRHFRLGPVYRMMSRGARYLEELPTFAASAPEARVTTVASRHDLVVYPVDTAHLEGAEQVTLEAIGHLGLLTERAVHDLVTERMAAQGP